MKNLAKGRLVTILSDFESDLRGSSCVVTWGMNLPSGDCNIEKGIAHRWTEWDTLFSGQIHV